MRFSLLLCALLGASPACAQSAKKPKQRSIKDLVSIALKSGATTQLPIDFGEDLGFTTEMPAKMIEYEVGDTENSFYVIYPSSDAARTSPIALVWQRVTMKMEKSTRKYDARIFRSSLSGVLEAAAQGGGQGDDVWHESRPMSGLEGDFLKIKDFFLKAADSIKAKK